MGAVTSSAGARRALLTEDPFVESAGAAQRSWSYRAHWPAQWISVVDEPAPPLVAGYRLFVRVDEAMTCRIHVSADERYVLHLDGECVGRGPDRGDLEHWTFQSFDLSLDAGEHWLAARVWTIGDNAPYAQHSLRHGFLLAAEGRPDFTTGTGDWRAAVLPGHGAVAKGAAWGCGDKLELDGRAYPWGWQQGQDRLQWAPAPVTQPAVARRYANDMAPNRMLVPSILAPQWEAPWEGATVRLVTEFPGGETHAIPVHAAASIPAEVEQWQALLTGAPLTGAPLTVAAGSKRRVLIDLDD
jgi:alpha-L-rhamnosidase